MPNQKTLEDLPNEVLQKVAKSTNAPELARLGLTSHKFKNIASVLMDRKNIDDHGKQRLFSFYSQNDLTERYNKWLENYQMYHNGTEKQQQMLFQQIKIAIKNYVVRAKAELQWNSKKPQEIMLLPVCKLTVKKIKTRQKCKLQR